MAAARAAVAQDSEAAAARAREQTALAAAAARGPVTWEVAVGVVAVMAASWAEAGKAAVETARVGPLAVEARVAVGWAAMQAAARVAVARVAVG